MTERLDIPVSGGSLAAYRYPGPAGSLPVLAIHGITGNSHAWVPTVNALGAEVSLIAVDLRGRGRSHHLPGPFGIAAHVQDMVAVLDALGAERAVIVGHSLGAYITAALATAHPDRVAGLVLVDGGLPVPRPREVDPEPFMKAFLGPTLARLDETFASPRAYHEWWARHPAVAGSDIDPADLAAYADHDLIGPEGAFHSAVNPDCIAPDGRGVLDATDADQLTPPTVVLCAPRGLTDGPDPMQPLTLVEQWVGRDPEHRRGRQIPDTNHYSIALGRSGAAAVASEITAALSG